MISNFHFYMPANVNYGVGIAMNMTEKIRGNNVLLISDPFLFKSGLAEKIGAGLQGKTVTYFSEIEPNPSTVSVDKCAEIARAAKTETVIGLGGGSSWMWQGGFLPRTNPGSIYDYYAGGQIHFLRARPS